MASSDADFAIMTDAVRHVADTDMALSPGNGWALMDLTSLDLGTALTKLGKGYVEAANGFGAAVWTRTGDDGGKEIAITYRGLDAARISDTYINGLAPAIIKDVANTSKVADILAKHPEAAGKADAGDIIALYDLQVGIIRQDGQQGSALALARAVMSANKDADITLVGNDLGGALARMVSTQTGLDAQTFSASYVPLTTVPTATMPLWANGAENVSARYMLGIDQFPGQVLPPAFQSGLLDTNAVVDPRTLAVATVASALNLAYRVNEKAYNENDNGNTLVAGTGLSAGTWSPARTVFDTTFTPAATWDRWAISTPGFNTLKTASADLTSSFETVLRANSKAATALLGNPDAYAATAHEGTDAKTSQSRTDAELKPDAEILFRALTKSAVGDHAFYDYFAKAVGTLDVSGAAAGRLADPIMKLQLGALRDALNATDTMEAFEASGGRYFAGGGPTAPGLPEDHVSARPGLVTSTVDQLSGAQGGSRAQGVLDVDAFVWDSVKASITNGDADAQAQAILGVSRADITGKVSTIDSWGELVVQAGNGFKASMDYAPGSTEAAAVRVIVGGIGSDRLEGSSSKDYIIGGGSTIQNKADLVEMTAGGDVVALAQGTVSYEKLGHAVSVDMGYAAGYGRDSLGSTLVGVSTVMGGAGDDTFTNLGSYRTVRGGAGDDTFSGMGGGTYVDGGQGIDTASFNISFAAFSSAFYARALSNDAGGYDFSITENGSLQTFAMRGIERFSFTDGIVSAKDVADIAIFGTTDGYGHPVNRGNVVNEGSLEGVALGDFELPAEIFQNNGRVTSITAGSGLIETRLDNTHVYLTGGPGSYIQYDSQSFSALGDTLTLRSASGQPKDQIPVAINYEQTVTNPDGSTSTVQKIYATTLTYEVRDVHDQAPTQILITSNTDDPRGAVPTADATAPAHVTENATGQVVALLRVDQLDTSREVTWGLSDDLGGRIVIETPSYIMGSASKVTGINTAFAQVKVIGGLDHEESGSRTIHVTATDGTTTVSRDITFQVDDVNEAPTDILAQVSTLSVGATAGLTAVKLTGLADPEGASDAIYTGFNSYDSLFKVAYNPDGSQQLVLARAIAETDAGTHSVGLIGFDTAGHFIQKTVEVAIGSPTVTYDLSKGPPVGGTTHDKLVGTSFDDTLIPTPGRDIVDGGSGFDTAILLSAGATVVDLNEGRGYGGYANGATFINIEGLDGTALNDGLFGDAKDNLLQGEGGDDVLDGRAGNDHLIGNTGNDLLFGGDGDDLLDGNEGNDRLDGGAGINVINGGTGNDTIYVAGKGVDTIDGGDGSDLLTLYQAGRGVTFAEDGTHFAFVDKILLDTQLSTISNVEGISGTKFGDKIYMADGVNFASGLDGNDNITGNDQSNTIYGGDGNDTLNGGAGNDFLYGGLGNNKLDGGDGYDYAFFESFMMGGVTVDMEAGTAKGGNPNAPVMTATLKNIEGVVGTDTNDFIQGSSRADGIMGGNGDDVIFGNGGNDLMQGGAGNNILLGGAGYDTFSYSPLVANDHIGDFTSGEDKIDLRQLNTNWNNIDKTEVNGSAVLTVHSPLQAVPTTITLDHVALSSISSTDFLFA